METSIQFTTSRQITGLFSLDLQTKVCVWPLLCHVAVCAFPLVGMLDFVIGATYKERTPMEHLIANCCAAWWCSVLKHLSHSSGFYFLEHLCKASTGATLAFTDPSDART